MSDDIRVRVVIVGAGPHGLAVASHLRLAGIPSGDLLVVDPAGEWLHVWRSHFRRLGIEHLRSPAVHHPGADPFALSKFARAQARTGELHYRYALPGTRLFEDFCEQLIEETGLQGLPLRARSVRLHPDGRVQLDNGAHVRAEQVVWATNPAVPTSPIALGPHVHPWHVFDRGRGGSVRRAAVVGAGLSAAHLVERLVELDVEVEWCARRPVVERDFDTDPGWLGPKYMNDFDKLGSPSERLGAVVRARGGGTIPRWMLRRLRRAEREGRLSHRIGEVRGQAGAARPQLWVGADRVDVEQVWLATGDQPTVYADPALAECCSRLGVVVVCGRPVLDPMLRLPGSRIHVVGRLAQLVLGPTAGNLAGARRGAELVVAATAGGRAASRCTSIDI